MRKHNGMRQHDIVVLLKIASLGRAKWQLKDLAFSLYLSPAEISTSLNRSRIAGLIDFKKARLNKQSLLEFIQFGFKYVFPAHVGGIATGFATAHSHPFMKKYFSSEMIYVWPDSEGDQRGLVIEPLYPKQGHAIKEDPKLHKMLALVDVIRIGKVREVRVAAEELKRMLLNESN